MAGQHAMVSSLLRTVLKLAISFRCALIILQTLLSEQESHFTFEWKKAADMPFNMTDYPLAVVINKCVYIGGRIGSPVSSRSLNASQTVMVYNSELDVWSTLPPSGCVLFAMAAINSQLVLIGGHNCSTPSEGVTGQLRVWDPDGASWREMFAPMPTARWSPSVITYVKWLVAVGLNVSKKSYQMLKCWIPL
jgi:hypothetical protein